MKIIATLPTYNERQNLETLIDAVLQAHPRIELLVIDDNSPDGTHELVRGRAASDARVHLLHRTEDKGRGTAGVAGFLEALRLGADYIVEMDADWSHHPRFIAPMVERAEAGADVVVGSRLAPGGGEVGRSPARKWITLLANGYIRTLLRLPVRDCTSGFRVFRRWVLERIDWSRVESRGPALVQEVLVAARALGARVEEHPILFEERKAGASSLTSRILVAGLMAQWRLRFRPAPVRTL
ncbi:MAG: polyprenol monophosphomannose synthase [Candidatus Sumerlaeia bacterium]|nr:polyprenol monophosphomannose synthase [Candidatus Sumerlaeia bacterium]